MMRKILHRVVQAIAGQVYQLGVWLYTLSDRIDGWDGEVDERWDTATPTHTWNSGNSTGIAATWTVSGNNKPPA